MKFLLSVAVIAVFTPAVLAQSPQPPAAKPRSHSLSLDVRNIGSGSSLNRSSSGFVDSDRAPAYDGQSVTNMSLSRTKASSSSTTLDINVRNFSRVPDKATVEWYFFSKPINSRNQAGLKIHDHDSRELDLAPMITRKVEASSDPVKRTTHEQVVGDVTSRGGQEYQGVSSRRYRTGDKLAGWVVRLLAEGKIIAIKGSEPSFEAIGRSDVELKRFIEAASPPPVVDPFSPRPRQFLPPPEARPPAAPPAEGPR